MEFSEWLRKVDAILVGMCGMGHRDLPDMCWRDQYEDEATPAEAVSCLCGDSIEELMENCM
jgi:hypothetical protein